MSDIIFTDQCALEKERLTGMQETDMIMAKINWLTTHTTMAATITLRYGLIIPAMRRYEDNKATLNPRTARQ